MAFDPPPTQPSETPLYPDSNGQSDRGDPRSETSKSPPRVTIDQASNDLFPRGSIHLNPADLRKNFHTRVSGELAKGLWYLLGSVVVIHLVAVVGFSWRLTHAPLPGDTDRTERIQSAIATVGDAAKTLYAVLTPLATAVTGYYFSTGGDSGSNASDPE